MSPIDDAVAGVQTTLTRVDANLAVLRTFVAALARSGVPPCALAGTIAQLDRLEAAAAALAAHPALTVELLARETH